MSKKRVQWVNCAKLMAILAVLTDHSAGILYRNPDISLAAYFSVSLFILISGMMCFSSNRRHRLNWFQTFVRSGKGIFLAYLLANAVYLVWDQHFLNVSTYLEHVARFDLSGPFYYVLLYLQLMLISRLLSDIVERIPTAFGLLWEVGIGAVVLFVCMLSLRYTSVMEIYGAGKLFGGTYLFLFYLGMLFAKHGFLEPMRPKHAAGLAAVSLVLWVVWWRFACHNRFALDAKLPFATEINPPSITLCVSAILMLLFVRGAVCFLESCQHLQWIPAAGSWLGQHTLYIFLYHLFFLSYVLLPYFPIQNIWGKRIVFFAGMLLGPIALEYLVGKCKRILLGSNTATNRTPGRG